MKTQQNINQTTAQYFISVSSPKLLTTPLAVTPLEKLKPHHNYYFQTVNQLNANICAASLEHENTSLVEKIMKDKQLHIQQSETEESIFDWNMALESTMSSIDLLLPILSELVNLQAERKCHGSTATFPKNAEYEILKNQFEKVIESIGLPIKHFDCESDGFLNRLFVFLHGHIQNIHAEILSYELQNRSIHLKMNLDNLVTVFRTPVQQLVEKIIADHDPKESQNHQMHTNCLNYLKQPFQLANFPIGKKINNKS